MKMKMNVSTQTLLSEDVIELLLKNYIITTGQTQLKDVLSVSNDRNNNNNDNSSSTTLIENSQASTQTSTQTFIQTSIQTDNYQIKEYISKLPSDVIIGIAKYISVEDFYNFSITCKKLYSTFYCASIWYNFLNRDYTKQFKALKSSSDLYDTYRYFDTNTLKAKDLSIADMGKNWKLDEDGCAVLTDVCWFDVNGEFKYVTNGTYIVKCVIKIENVSGGLVGLDFIAKHDGVEEPYKFSMSRICYDNLKGIGWQPLTCFKIKVDNPQLYTKVRIQIVNKKMYWKYGFSIKSIILKRVD